MSTVVSFEVRDKVALVTMERPEVHNAMSVEVFDQLREAAERAGADDDVGAVLVSGRGGSFSSGLDVSALAVDGGITEDFIVRLQESFTAFEDIDKPTVAAIEGYCYGGGIQLAAACHVRLVAPSARLSILERRWGLVPDLGGTWRIPRLIGLGATTELTMTARKFDADEALRNGFAQVELPEDGAQDAAFQWTRNLAHGPGAVRRASRLVRENWGAPRDEALRRERLTQLQCIAGPDVTEAVGAFFEKREPQFIGE